MAKKKACSQCSKKKLDTLEFFAVRSDPRGKRLGILNVYCRKCQTKRRIENRRKCGATAAEEAYFRMLLKKHGLCRDKYNKIIEEQEGRCPICLDSIVEGKRRPHVDHDHKTKMVRAILCNGCNTGIAALRENVGILYRAIKYIERFNNVETC